MIFFFNIPNHSSSDTVPPVFRPYLHFRVTKIPPAELLPAACHRASLPGGLRWFVSSHQRRLQSPEVQVEVLRFQDVYGWNCGARVDCTVGGPGPGEGRVRRGKDVVDAELNLGLWFAWQTGLRSSPGARSLRVQRAEGGVTVGPAMFGLRRLEGRLPGIPKADLYVPPAAAAAKVAIFKQVEHGLAAGGESPEVALALLVALCPRDLQVGEDVPAVSRRTRPEFIQFPTSE